MPRKRSTILHKIMKLHKIIMSKLKLGPRILIFAPYYFELSSRCRRQPLPFLVRRPHSTNREAVDPTYESPPPRLRSTARAAREEMSLPYHYPGSPLFGFFFFCSLSYRSSCLAVTSTRHRLQSFFTIYSLSVKDLRIWSPCVAAL